METTKQDMMLCSVSTLVSALTCLRMARSPYELCENCLFTSILHGVKGLYAQHATLEQTYFQVTYGGTPGYYHLYVIFSKAVSHTYLVTKIELDIASPQLIIPKGSASNSFLVADLGNISLFTGFHRLTHSDAMEKICASISSMNVKSSKKGIQEPIVNDVHVFAEIERPVNNEQHRKPGSQIIAEISEVNVSLTDYQYNLLMGIMQVNMKEKSPTSYTEVPVAQTEEIVSNVSEKLVRSIKCITLQQNYLDLKISFTLPKIGLELIRKGRPDIQFSDPIVSVLIEKLAFTLKRYSNNTLHVRTRENYPSDLLVDIFSGGNCSSRQKNTLHQCV